mmetsp:Transcript_24828/g.54142  ORF Transcript_24828/g.54142 Transcript_24828/m.54142 type:complete len:101 (-) Transcript_24828:1639-1941(-)
MVHFSMDQEVPAEIPGIDSRCVYGTAIRSFIYLRLYQVRLLLSWANWLPFGNSINVKLPVAIHYQKGIVSCSAIQIGVKQPMFLALDPGLHHAATFTSVE